MTLYRTIQFGTRVCVVKRTCLMQASSAVVSMSADSQRMRDSEGNYDNFHLNPDCSLKRNSLDRKPLKDP